MKTVIVLGSSRKQGNTYKVVSELQGMLGADVINLSDKNIGIFDYEFKNSDDDFIPTIKHIVDNYDLVLFATPVYWYTMSATLKTFFDRMTDCMYTEKETGRKLNGKYMGAIACGSDENEVEAFFLPFEKSADYLKMNYAGSLHTWIENDKISDKLKEQMEAFVKEIKAFEVVAD